jgi:hypothetical protein
LSTAGQPWECRVGGLSEGAHTRASGWQCKTGSGIVGQPIAYRGLDGREFAPCSQVPVAGPGRSSPATLYPRYPTGVLGLVATMANRKTRAGGTLYVFALPYP